ncbi:MAG TPA: 50S ribosomal protein L2 [Candidatus Thermoplasmatota archaeon]|uniref:50S ribosomal protein L2 n=1 Tax=uncultured euryarchaeote Rifle_16ft_4_minimus_14142 TaxID=1665188 RepID=A0A0H4T0J3_9EURY|nr:ribosomal protein L2 [uncultured euryarchaeote Rifle_16ft_4_minimus_14142]HKZ60720.1 50S ribosomal protein L2 [Candidatus Thermoplasmatota archaeon]
MGKRILTRRKGKGRQFRSPSHRHKGGEGGVKYPSPQEDAGPIVDIIHDPGRTAPLVKVAFAKAGESLLIATEGAQVGQTVQVGNSAPVASANILPLIKIPIGARIFAIEARPGDGGRFARAAGSSGVLVSQGAQVIVQFASGQFKALDPLCRATLGRSAGGGRTIKPWTKAGKKWHGMRSRAQVYPRVRGVAMNPVDHPHGGGAHQHVGRPSTVSAGTPPGAKVGRLSPQKRKGRRRQGSQGPTRR